MSRILRCLLITLFPVLLASPALAHTGGDIGGGLVGGFFHPIFGPDHVVAMVAVGLWGAFLGPPAIWLLPVVFPLVMAMAGAAGIISQAQLPGVETGIALSAILLGLMVAFAVRPALWIAAILVGSFAIFHGYAHGRELPPEADAVAFCVGFVVSTGLLHLTGIAFSLLTRWPAGRVAVRTVGCIIAIVGVAYLSGMA